MPSGDAGSVRVWWRAAALGLVAGFVLISHISVLEPLMMVSFGSALEIGLAMTLFAFGVAAKRGRLGRLGEAVMAVAALAVVYAAFTNRDFTSMAIMSKLYYPVPLPKSGIANQISLLITVLVVPALFLPMGWGFGSILAGAGRLRGPIGAFLVGQALGVGLAYGFSPLGPHLLFAGGLCLALVLLLRAIPAAVGVAAIVTVVTLFQVYPQRTFFNFGLTEYKYLDGGYGHDVKCDFITFMDDRCLGVVVDNIMMMFSCRDTDWVPAETEFMYKAILDPFHKVSQHGEGTGNKVVLEPERVGEGLGKSPVATAPAASGAAVIPPADRQPLDVIDVGRSIATNVRAIELFLGGENNNSTIEYDPKIAEFLRPGHEEYLGKAMSRPTSLVLTGDWRTNLEELADQGKKYDYVFYSGIGTKTYILPRSYVFAEHFLLTEEGTRLIFDRLLKPGGVLFIDWGSSETREADWFVASFPDDVSTLVYWTTLSFFPLSGSPLLFVVASRDGERIAETDRHLQRLSGFVKITPQDRESCRTSDDKPFLQNSMQRTIGFIHLGLSALFLLVIRSFVRRTRARNGVGLGWGAAAAGAGLAAGLAETIFACHNALILAPFGIPSWNVLEMVFVAGTAIGFLAVGRWARSPIVAALAAVLFAGGLAALYGLHRSQWVNVAPLAAGLGAGMALSTVLARVKEELQHVALAWWLLGGGFSLFCFKPPILLVGYSGLAMIAAGISLIAVAASFRRAGSQDA
jgi:hypothetical protein